VSKQSAGFIDDGCRLEADEERLPLVPHRTRALIAIEGQIDGDHTAGKVSREVFPRKRLIHVVEESHGVLERAFLSV